MLGHDLARWQKDDFDGFRKCDDSRLADGLIGGGNFDVRSVDDLRVVERGKHAAVTFIDLLRISKPQTVRELGIVWIGSGLIRRFERSWDAVCRRRRVARTCFFVRALFLYGCIDGFVV